jgi:hypothetical protein
VKRSGHKEKSRCDIISFVSHSPACGLFQCVGDQNWQKRGRTEVCRHEKRTYQSRPSSRPSPLVAQLPLTLHSLFVSPPASPNFSLISSGFSAPAISCLLQNTSKGTPASSSSESIVNSSARDVGRRSRSEESMT